MREPIAALWQTLEETSARHLSEQQAESFVATAYAITEAINSRAVEWGTRRVALSRPTKPARWPDS